MRVIVGANAEGATWIPSAISAAEAQGVIDALMSKAVLAASATQATDLLTQAVATTVNAGDPQLKSRLMELVKRAPLSSRVGRPPVDVLLEDCVQEGLEANLVSVPVTNRFNGLLSQRRTTFPSRTPRQDVFDRLIKPLATACSTVIVLDQYLLHEVAEGYGDGPLWFLEELARTGVRDVTILSLSPSECTVQKPVDIIRRHLENTKSMAARADGSTTTVRFVTQAHDWRPRNSGGQGRPLHLDRHLRFVLGGDLERITPVLTIGPGLSAFKNSVSSSAFSISEEFDRAAARDREAPFLRCGRTSPIELKI